MTDTAVPDQIYQVFIQATPEAIWDAITTPEWTERYFYGTRMQLTSDGRITSTDSDGEVWGDAPVIEADPPRRLVYGWQSRYDDELSKEAPSRVTWEIEPAGEGVCLLTVTHDQLDGAPQTAARVAGPGWMWVISGLKTLLETGVPLTR